MQEWAQLTPEERRVAREKYRSIKSLPPQKRDEVRQKWHEYQQSQPPAAPAPAAPASAAPEAAPGG
jgi:hypothetical protein